VAEHCPARSDMTAYNLTLNEAVDMAQNPSQWRLMPMYGAMHS